GASAKASATFALASGEMMYFIQRYMQFGWAAFDAIIHVSDQPVVPSFGTIACTGTGGFSAAIRLTMYCQVVPTADSPDLNDVTCFAYVEPSQYSPMFGRCCFSS